MEDVAALAVVGLIYLGIVLGSIGTERTTRERICLEAKAKGYQLEQCEEK